MLPHRTSPTANTPGSEVTVVYVPVLQQAFGTVGLSAADWLLYRAIASSVLWLREIDKLLARLRR
jgi:Ca2+-transporting ATPase